MVICEIHLPAVRSLKGKRRVVKGLIERLHRRFRLSIAETGFHDLHQRALIGIAVVDQTPSHLDQLIQGLREAVELVEDIILVRWDVEIVGAER